MLTENQKQQILDAHNVERAIHCVPPLKWDTTLEKYAQQWADNCTWGHWKQTASNLPVPKMDGNELGENLAMAWGGLNVIETGLKGWIDEKQQWKCGQDGWSMATGHYTQMIWPSTTKVGCATAKCQMGDYLVCEYSPPGNWIGETAVPANKCFTNCGVGKSKPVVIPPKPVTVVPVPQPKQPVTITPQKPVEPKVPTETEQPEVPIVPEEDEPNVLLIILIVVLTLILLSIVGYLIFV